MDNAEIADRLDAFAAVLELGDANPYTIRAYRRAAETVRHSGVPVAELERDLVPDLVGLGRYLGLSAQRAIDIARALDIRTAGELREAAAAGRLRDVPGIGPKTEAQIVSALARETEARSPRGVWLNRAWDLVGGIARALDAEPAGDVRRWCDSCHQLAVVRAASRPDAVLARFAELPQIVAVIEQGERHAVGVTVDGVPVELKVPEPNWFGTAVMRATRRGGGLRSPGRRLVPPRAPRGRLPRRAAAPRRDRADPRGPALSHDVVRRAGEHRGDGARRSRTGL